MVYVKSFSAWTGCYNVAVKRPFFSSQLKSKFCSSIRRALSHALVTLTQARLMVQAVRYYFVVAIEIILFFLRKSRFVMFNSKYKEEKATILN